MELYYLSDLGAKNGTVTIIGPEARHISRVLRHVPGDRVYATDGLGAEYELELCELSLEKVIGKVLGRRVRPRQPDCRLTLAQVIINGDRRARVVEEVTQLGVSEVIPLKTRRTVGGLSDVKLARLRKVATEAMKCSTRTVLPEIGQVMELNELAGRVAEYEFAGVAYEGEQDYGLADVFNRRAESVLLVVGPEGGFEPDEVTALKAAGARCFSMGPRRLRAETAGVAAAVLALQLLGELGGSRKDARLRRADSEE